ncbi:DNA/RNA nuclease SfsA [Pseudobacteriovorax antillogorgiicola]|uniref:Sugar fermentation stimulation protein homolog n=1 Tax=Pseudobacteriovorax antillogorgiicola TaxID=1513793 RepID=A0A1Y6BNM4_9BACT|nr:DNA/RNA nuclease SfsA [Pseudobacteriovorax antillogorgiicola]TCS53902.1 sugar fermentation stimulation protein A [Pseudobacteriovorax antillogorgiicola]SMF20740.1 sugar fermentation stimulation protein A [Pseudobacteriovorax antillogorgiicola]
MRFSSPLVQGTLIKRYKRFLADVTLDDGSVITAHCANTGSMKTCGDPGDRIALRYDPNPKRKLAYSWELTHTKGGFIGINTMNPNRIVEEALVEGRIAEFGDYTSIRREVKYGEKSRIDFLLEDDSHPDCYIEVKNVTLKVGQHLAFPDAVTSRGLKHLQELTRMVEQGHRAALLFVANRPEGNHVAIANDIDPAYGDGILKARDAGVEILAYRVKSDLNGMRIQGKIPVHF